MKRKPGIVILGTLAALLTIPLIGYAEQSAEKTGAGKDVIVSKVVVVPGANKEQIFDKVCDWSRRYTRSSCVDKSTGTIVSAGEISYPSSTIDRIQYTFLFTVKNSVQGNRNTVSFEKILMQSPTVYDSENNAEIPGKTCQITSERDRTAAKKALTYLTDKLESYLLTGSDEGHVIIRCPSCEIVSSSK